MDRLDPVLPAEMVGFFGRVHHEPLRDVRQGEDLPRSVALASQLAQHPRPDGHEVRVKQAGGHVGRVPGQPEEGDVVPRGVGPLDPQVELQGGGGQNLRPELREVDLRLRGVHAVLPVRVHREEQEEAAEFGFVDLGTALLSQHVILVEQGREALLELLDVEVRVVAFRVCRGRCILAQLVLGEDVEPDHLLVQGHRELVLQVLHGDVRPQPPVPVPQKAVDVFQRHARRVVVQEVQQVPTGRGDGRPGPEHPGVRLHSPREALHEAEVAPERLHAVDVVEPVADLYLLRRAHGIARPHDVKGGVPLVVDGRGRWTWSPPHSGCSAPEGGGMCLAKGRLPKG